MRGLGMLVSVRTMLVCRIRMCYSFLMIAAAVIVGSLTVMKGRSFMVASSVVVMLRRIVLFCVSQAKILL